MTRKKTNLPCRDCGINTANINGQWEFYMVTDEVWQAAVGTPAAIVTDGDFLCIGCLEMRLGTPGDFTDCLANDPRDPGHTPRLRSRLTGAKED